MKNIAISDDLHRQLRHISFDAGFTLIQIAETSLERFVREWNLAREDTSAPRLEEREKLIAKARQ